MEITDTFHAASRAAWRGWLEAHHRGRSEIWLITYRKGTGVPSIPFGEAVEEALCLEALRGEPDAWRHWQGFPAPYRRIRAAYVDSARDQPPEFEKRLRNLVRKTARGTAFGYGIEGFFPDPAGGPDKESLR